MCRVPRELVALCDFSKGTFDTTTNSSVGIKKESIIALVFEVVAFFRRGLRFREEVGEDEEKNEASNLGARRLGGRRRGRGGAIFFFFFFFFLWRESSRVRCDRERASHRLAR